ncbi:inactive protein RESTRICTED TEV MOVEMENT 1 [Artemisia annua]|uniref:Inactive protein RESTRICTED TEV MOVEMENT 1 n=1 Tax=Artemisia annua TaxID=35608 RepID=A0A2U1LNI6_ARTAN|nr:inactive protein RESTRICTED TEV MOVEMENT 1 [Artemisia annua]
MLKVCPKKLGAAQQEMVCWDECGKTEIVQIFISHDGRTIKSIQFSYAEDGEVRLSQVHGDRDTALNLEIVTLDYPSEYLTSFSGHLNEDEDGFSIEFGTNKRRYGPFGDEDPDYDEPIPFQYKFDKQSFGGFHGGIYKNQLYTLGVFIKPIAKLGGSLK